MIDAMKQALEALDYAADIVYSKKDDDIIGVARKSLRQAIAEAEKAATLQEISDIGREIEQEPVARFNWNEAKFEWLTEYSYEKHHMKPLYLAPLKREWVSLSDEELRAICNSLSRQDGWDGDGWDLALKQAIEAALRSKNT
jgi:hypothetical protein